MNITTVIAGFAIGSVLMLSPNSYSREARYNELLGKLGASSLPTRCTTCHGAGGNPKAHNLFGKDYIEIFVFSFRPKFPETKQMSKDEKWAFLLNLDSDSDGRSNFDELKQGKNPGIPD